jgi:hypothetical protein
MTFDDGKGGQQRLDKADFVKILGNRRRRPGDQGGGRAQASLAGHDIRRWQGGGSRGSTRPTFVKILGNKGGAQAIKAAARSMGLPC